MPCQALSWAVWYDSSSIGTWWDIPLRAYIWLWSRPVDGMDLKYRQSMQPCILAGVCPIYTSLRQLRPEIIEYVVDGRRTSGKPLWDTGLAERNGGLSICQASKFIFHDDRQSFVEHKPTCQLLTWQEPAVFPKGWGELDSRLLRH